MGCVYFNFFVVANVFNDRVGAVRIQLEVLFVYLYIYIYIYIYIHRGTPLYLYGVLFLIRDVAFISNTICLRVIANRFLYNPEFR